MKVAIVYHSGFGHTQMVAEHIAKGVAEESVSVMLFNVEDPNIRFGELNEADAIVFGSPTYFGNVSAEFKKFMESTASIWFNQEWKGKLATGFTNSSTRNGDKLHTLNSLSLFAAQHGMMWIPLGIMPTYDEGGNQNAEPNGMASYLGLMTMSANSHQSFTPPGDLGSAELFGRRIAQVTKGFTSTRPATTSLSPETAVL